ncbi:MAG TPA: glycine dehydrogenase subunit 2 [Bacteroidetes bacterium]|nr:glycine dehydrogenase subunit 2 [Bacteroidota bacterium]
MPEKLIFEMSAEGRKGYTLPKLDVPAKKVSDLIPKGFVRSKSPILPEVSENEVMRHFVALSRMNHHLDKGFYPLGSCTMKYNPKINEAVCRLDGFAGIHPLQDEEDVQGALELMYYLSQHLCEITGLKTATLQPAAGAHGELTGMMLIRAYHENLGNPRKKVLLPDSAHGTNPASAVISGYEPVQIHSNEKGLIDVDDLKANLDEDVAALMLTNPNTLGLFESRIQEIKSLLDKVGALLYMDGANLNALLGIVRPGDFGVDVLHINLHKTFSTPHGGGGPGSGPVAVSHRLIDFLPAPVIKKEGAQYILDFNRPKSIGKVFTFFGNFGVMVRAFTYIRMLGAGGLVKVSKNALLNANYLLEKLKPYFDLPYQTRPMHEFVLSGDRQKKLGVKTSDMAKRLLDFGVHAPTIYFPSIVHEAIMIEPTDTESKEALDEFADMMIRIAKEVETEPDLVKNSPVTTPVSRLDEAGAARNLKIRWTPESAG